MPVIKVNGGYKVYGVNAIHKTKKEAEEQLKAIKANQRKGK